MCRHVVRAFTGVDEGQGFRTERVCRGLHIDPDIRVCILVQRQSRRSVLDEEVHQADMECRQVSQLLQDFRGDQVESTGPRSELQTQLSPLVFVSNCHLNSKS